MFQNIRKTEIIKAFPHKRISAIEAIITNFCLINQIYLALVCIFLYKEKYECNTFTQYNLQTNQII